MIKIYKTEESIVNEIEKVEDGCWINMVTPTMEECINISEQFDIDIADVRAALDDEESSRVDLEDGYTLILVDIPSIEIRHKQEAYTTIPLGIILADGVKMCIRDSTESKTYLPCRFPPFFISSIFSQCFALIIHIIS